MRPKRIRNKRNTFYVSIQTKLLMVFLVTTSIIFGVNIYMYFNINRTIVNIDKVYASNAMLNELQNNLTQVHRNMESFLDTRDSDAIGAYLRSWQEYKNGLEVLNDVILGDEAMLAEKNIRSMSENYLEITEDAIEAKRGRNVVKYKEFYEDASELFGYINSYIYSLNKQKFEDNSNKYELLFSSLRYSEVVNMMILGMASVLSITLIILLTREIINPLKRLAEAADEVGKGTLDLELELSQGPPRDEVGIVTNAFNQMVGSLKIHIEQLKERMELESAMKEKQLMMEAHLKDAQLKYLQAQINPHFLFNTLNAGAQLAMMEDAEKTYQYVQSVADFFRYNVKKNNDVVTLREEIELVDNYIYIINVRFSGEIHFKKNIDEELVNVQVPSMILQPLVENSINHGLRGIEWENIVELSIYREGRNICISVRDNGAGMSDEKIERVLHSRLSAADLKDATNGVGLDNVIGRLRLFYDRENVMEITSEGENMGTEIAIYIPLEG